jgi:hypothetical protein
MTQKNLLKNNVKWNAMTEYQVLELWFLSITKINVGLGKSKILGIHT